MSNASSERYTSSSGSRTAYDGGSGGGGDFTMTTGEEEDPAASHSLSRAATDQTGSEIDVTARRRLFNHNKSVSPGHDQ